MKINYILAHIIMFVIIILTGTANATQKGFNYDDYCGVWMGQENSMGKYIIIKKVNPNKYIYLSMNEENGKIYTNSNPLDINNHQGYPYLLPKNNHLMATFRSSNFYATHGMEFDFKLDMSFISKNKMKHSVYCSIRGGETEVNSMTKVNVKLSNLRIYNCETYDFIR